MWDGFKAEQEGRILPSLLPCITQRHPTASPLLRALGAICDPGWDVAVLGTSTASQGMVAVGRSEPSPVSTLLGTHSGPVTLPEVRCESAGGLVSSCLFLLLIFIASINVESQLSRPLLLALLTQCWGRMSLRRDRNRCSRVLWLPWPGWGQGLGVPSALGWCPLLVTEKM